MAQEKRCLLYTSYFGEKGADNDHVGESDTRVMYEKVMEELNDLKKVVESSDKLFMYAENFVYAPSIQKTLEFLRAKKSKILYMKGEESQDVYKRQWLHRRTR